MNVDNQIKIFLVFKDSFSRLLYNQHLNNLGYKNNILIETGEDCIKKLDLEPAIIIMDFDHNPADCLDTLGKVKMINSKIDFFVLATRSKEQILTYVMQAGASAFITKGDLDLEMLRVALEKTIAARAPYQLATSHV